MLDPIPNTTEQEYQAGVTDPEYVPETDHDATAGQEIIDTLHSIEDLLGEAVELLRSLARNQ